MLYMRKTELNVFIGETRRHSQYSRLKCYYTMRFVNNRITKQVNIALTSYKTLNQNSHCNVVFQDISSA